MGANRVGAYFVRIRYRKILSIPARTKRRNRYEVYSTRSRSCHDHHWLGRVDSRTLAGAAGPEVAARALPRITGTHLRCNGSIDCVTRRPGAGWRHSEIMKTCQKGREFLDSERLLPLQ